MNTIEQDYIIDNLGADSWEQVKVEFSGLLRIDIYRKLCDMFPEDDNKELAKLTYTNINWVSR